MFEEFQFLNFLNLGSGPMHAKKWGGDYFLSENKIKNSGCDPDVINSFKVYLKSIIGGVIVFQPLLYEDHHRYC